MASSNYLKIVFSLLFILFCVNVKAQIADIGTPFITNYTKHDIGFESTNYSIIQDSRGIMYFANAYGILEFDGENWGIIQTATNKSNIISLAINKQNKIFVGAQGDIGYLDYHPYYKLIFRSLLNKIPEANREFGSVWKTYATNFGMVFYTWDGLYVYHNDTIEYINTPGFGKGSFMVNDDIYLQSDKGLFMLENLQPVKSELSDYFIDKSISFMLPYAKNEILIGTLSNGLYRVNGSTITKWEFNADYANKFSLKDGLLMKNGQYAFLTSHNGVLFVNKNAEVSKHITKSDGLQTNNIVSMKSDNLGNLWFGSTAVDYMKVSSPFRKVPLHTEEQTAIYSSVIYHNKLYLASHSGIYYLPWNSEQNTRSTKIRVEGTDDITWNLQEIDSTLWASTEKGFYTIENSKATLIKNTHGAWLVKQIPEKPSFFVGATYTGLVLFQKQNGKISYVKHLAGFTESGRSVEFDENGNLWVCHGYKGAYKISFNRGYTEIMHVAFYDNKKGFPEKIYNGVNIIDNRIVFTTKQGFHTYNSEADSIVPLYDMNKQFGIDGHVRFIKQHENTTWFMHRDETGYMEYFPDGTISKNTTSFSGLNEQYIPGFENVFITTDGKAIFGTKDGLVIYNSSISGNHNTEFKVLIRKVLAPLDKKELYCDRLHYLCDTIEEPYHSLLYKNNSVKFKFASSFLENTEKNEYSFYLDGLDKDWSDWTSLNEKEYTNLREGEYIFRIKARNGYNKESSEETYSFEILPPWYRSIWAYFAYVLAFVSFFILTIIWRNNQINQAKVRFIKEQQKQQEFERAKHNEEKLKMELENKNNELSALASNVIYKNERISEIKNRLQELTPIASVKVSKKLSTVLKFIHEELEDDNWENFEYRFNQAHNNFIKRFKEAFPELTPKDLKFCAYLRMNLNTKEIAQLLNMTVRGVENARYRIRGRVGLDSNSSLASFIITF